MKILVVDVGGTNTRLAYFDKKAKITDYSEHLTPDRTVMPLIAKYKNFDSVSIAVAGFVVDNTCRLTNSNLFIDGNKISKKMGVPVFLFNDLQMFGAALPYCDPEKLVNFTKNQIRKGTCLAIAPGTGLGISVLLFDAPKKQYTSIPTEAGHSDFAAGSKIEFRLAKFIESRKSARGKPKGPCSYEDVVSGMGIEETYEFLKKELGWREHPRIIKEGAKAPLISQLRKKDRLCKKTFELQSNVYGTIAKNMALITLPLGGIYFGCNIAVKNKDMFDSGFMESFLNSSRHVEMLKRIPICLVEDEYAILKGCAYAAKEVLKK